MPENGRVWKPGGGAGRTISAQTLLARQGVTRCQQKPGAKSVLDSVFDQSGVWGQARLNRKGR